MAKTPYALTLDTVEELKAAMWSVATRVDGLEEQVRRSVRPRGSKPRDRYVGKVQAGGITARSGTTLGQGSVEIHREIGGELIATGRTEGVYNLGTATASEDEFISIRRDQFDTFLTELVASSSARSFVVTGNSAGSVLNSTTLINGSLVGSGTSDSSLASFVSATGLTTISVAGRYLITFSADTNIKWTTASTDQGAMVLSLVVNSTIAKRAAGVVTPSSAADLAVHYMSGWDIRKLDANDTLHLSADQSNGLDDGSTVYPVNSGSIGLVYLGAAH